MLSCVRKNKNVLVLLLTAALAGCGGKGTPVSTSPSTTTQVTLTPATVSLVAGQVFQMSAASLSSSGAPPNPAPTITYNSSNTSVATVSSLGLVCAGTWDSFFINCNGNDSQGNPIAGSATVTASAAGVTSVPALVTVHPQVSSIVVSGPTVGSCFSIKTTFQLMAHACSSALPHDASGFCAPNGREISSLVGPFTWTAINPSVGGVDANGLVTAGTPGLTGIIASVGSVRSPAINFRSCMPIMITLHINGDPPGQPTEFATMNTADTRIVQADMVDELGVTTNSAPVTVTNINGLVAALAGNTLTAASAGGGSLVASCVPPTCGAGLNIPVYSNVFGITVNSSSPATFVYVTSSFAPPTGTTPTMIPIDTSKSPIVAGTAINLPGAVNSLVFARTGAVAFMGTSAGVALLNPSTNAVTLIDPFIGKVLAVSPDGSTAILSNAANDPGTGTPIQPVGPAQRLVIASASTNTVQSFVLPGAVAAAFTPDSSKAYVAVNCNPNPCAGGNGNVYVFSTFQTLQTVTNIGAASDQNFDVATVAAGPYAYFANSTGVQVMGVCNNVQQPTPQNPPTNSSTIQLMGSAVNSNLIVAVDSNGVNIETVNLNSVFSVNPPPITLSPANCNPPVSYSNQFVPFGLTFTARQLLVPTNGTGVNNGSHIVVLPVGLPQLLVAVPGGGGETIPLHTGGTEALSGGMTLDGNTAWVGVAGTNTVDQILLTNPPGTADALQIPTTFTKSDGTPAPPNIVAVLPK